MNDIPQTTASTSQVTAPADADAIKAYQYLVFSKLDGAVTAAMIHLGDALGLYTHLATSGPVTVAELAAATGLHERWVREWAHNQVAAKLLEGETDADDGSLQRVSMTLAAATVLADGTSPACAMGSIGQLPHYMASLEALRESFVTGIGQPFDAHGAGGALSIERSFEPWNRRFLVPVVIPALEGVGDRLRAGARVADVGCGAGSALRILADAFPESSYTGYDISQHALALARERSADLPNVRFVDPRVEPLPGDRSLDVVFTFDCLHDMTHPGEMAAAIHRALRPDGTWLLVDVKALDSFALNVAHNPMTSLMYGISVLSCMSSAMSEPGGAGLGTLGLPESRARELAAAAGFTRFRRLDVEHGANYFYEIRP